MKQITKNFLKGESPTLMSVGFTISNMNKYDGKTFIQAWSRSLMSSFLLSVRKEKEKILSFFI